MPFETAPTYIFDLHCDTLDRLALHKSFPDAGFMEQDAAIPDARMSSLASNDCHIALDRMAKAQYAWCQCFAAFIPDHMPADWGWQVFCAVRDFFQSQLAEHAALIEQVHDARDIRGIVDSGKCAGMFTVEGGSFIEGSLDRLHAAAAHVERQKRHRVGQCYDRWAFDVRRPGGARYGAALHGG